MYHKKSVRERLIEGPSEWNMHIVCIVKMFHTGYLDDAEVLTVCNSSHCGGRGVDNNRISHCKRLRRTNRALALLKGDARKSYPVSASVIGLNK